MVSAPPFVRSDQEEAECNEIELSKLLGFFKAFTENENLLIGSQIPWGSSDNFYIMLCSCTSAYSVSFLKALSQNFKRVLSILSSC